jgi:hypothetical protein
LCAHRWVETGFEFLVQWEPKRNGTPWEDSWEPEKNIHHELIESYFDGIALREKRMVTINISPLVHFTREKVAQTTALARTQCRPREHILALEYFTFEKLAMEFLEMVRSPSVFNRWINSSADEESEHPKLPLVYTKDPKDGVETYQVNYTTIEQVAAFCSFHSFMSYREGVGALRFSIGRSSNSDFMVVGVPMCFKVSLNRGTDLASTSLEFCTNHGNGMFGTLTHPPMVCGMMREVRHFNRVLAYAKAHLPATHPLARKGWKLLPSGVHTLAACVAVPVEPQPQQSRS